MSERRVPNPKSKPPRLLRSSLSGRVYIVTRYTEGANGQITASVKHDVTKDFDAILASLSPPSTNEEGERE